MKIKNLLEKKRFVFLFLAFGGVLTGLTLVFPKVGFIEWLSLVPTALVLLTVAERSSLGKLYWYGFFFFLCFYLVNFHWFINLYPLEFIGTMTEGAAAAVVGFAWIGLSLFQSIGGALVFVLFGAFCRTSFSKRYKISRPFFLATVWVIFEWSQTLFWFGVPWGRLPIGQSEYIVELQTASLFGSYFVTFLLVCVNALVAYALLEKSALKLCAIISLSLVIGNTAVGTLLYFRGSDSYEKSVKVAVIQGNISSSEKWSASTMGKILDVYEEYTLLAAEEGAQIIIWPETALPYTVYPSGSTTDYVRDLAKRSGATILVGAFSDAEDGGQLNSLIATLPNGTFNDTVYSKRRLVPFGEFVPMKELITVLVPPLADLVMTGEDLVEGEEANVISLDEGKAGCLICFDSIYEELARDSVLEGAEFIALSTNDSWFSDSAALYMHNAQAQIRAIENGRFVARAANTGISTIISDRGEVVELLEPLKGGYIVSEIELNQDKTLYSYVGNLFVYLCIATVTLVFLFEIYFVYLRKRIDKNQNK